MARKQSLKFSLMQELGNMYEAGKGRSKQADKNATSKARAQMKSMGMSYKETLYYNASENYIYSTNTFNGYIKHVKYFCNYIEEVTGNKKMTVEEAIPYIQKYADYLRDEKGWSAYSINIGLSAVCKATHQHLVDYEHPRRELKDITRSRGDAKNDALNNRLAAHELEAASVIGLRRSQLEKLKVSDIREVTIEDREVLEIHSKGKGGKMNIQTYYFQEDIDYIKELIKDKQPDDYVLNKDNFRDCDIHSCRAEHAKNTYDRIMEDMNNREGARQEYLHELKRLYERDGKHFGEHDFDKKYYARGEHKAYLEEHGFDTALDRVALAMVSLTCLSHYRVSVTAENYIWR